MIPRKYYQQNLDKDGNLVRYNSQKGPVEISEMSDSHLENSIHYFQKKSLTNYDTYYKILIQSLEKEREKRKVLNNNIIVDSVNDIIIL